MSREIDRLVAEKVLDIPGVGQALNRWVDPAWRAPHPLPRYSEDIGAVFAEVIPAMLNRELELYQGGNQWWASFVDDRAEAESGWRESPAEAICLAALRAVGVEP